jgi:plastocyanin
MPNSISLELKRSGITATTFSTAVLLLALIAVSLLFFDAVPSSGQISSQSEQITALKAQLQKLQAGQNDLSASLQELQSGLPTVNQDPTVRVITVEWAEFLSHQDRFFTNFIIVNQGDTVDLSFISNDTASHTFTIDSPYNFQINGSIPGTVDDPTGKTFTTQPTNDSPGVSCTTASRPGNVTCHGSFAARFAGIYEYYCVYHIHLGMFGYLVVLPNSRYSQSSSTTTTTSTQSTTEVGGARVNVLPGAGAPPNVEGYSPHVIKVILGVNSTVTWVNQDSIDHTVTSDTGYKGFNSGLMHPGEAYTFTFTAPGNYTYGCEFHPLMQGVVEVLSQS